MPYSYQTFSGGAAGINLAVSIPSLLRSHVSLYTNYDLSLGTYSALLVEGTNYNWVSDASITMLTATTGVTITLKRKTPTTGLLVGWTDGSNVDMDDLLTADRQNLYAVQEQEDASSLALANSGAALSQVAGALPYTPIATVATIPAAPTNGQRIEISNSTGIQSFSPVTGRPAGFVGATNLVVRLTYTTTGSTWQWVDYRATDPDGRYGTITSVSAAQTTANTANTAAAAAQTTANTANTAAAAAQTTANAKAPTASPTFTGTVTIPTGAIIAGFAPLASPAFTGTPTAATATAGTSSFQLATTAFVATAASAKADLASPTFTGTVTIPTGATIAGFAPLTSPTFLGTPAAPTAAVGTSTTQLATTAFVAANRLVSMTVNAGGTTPFPAAGGPLVVEFPSIPSWAKRITLMFSGVSTSGTSHVLIQAGISTGFVATGYLGTSNMILPGGSATVLSVSSTAGFIIYNNTALDIWHGCVRLNLLNQASNAWVADGVLGLSAGSTSTKNIGGSVALSGALDRIRVTTVNGTDTFDAGSINVLYE